MFEDEIEVDAEGWAVLPELPPVPEDLLTPFPDSEARFAAMAAEIEVEFAGMSAAERFEHEFGWSAIPMPSEVDAVTSEGAAAAMQHIGVQAERVQRIATAHRVAALLQAYEMSMADLAIRFPKQLGGRGGLGAQAFFKSFGLQTQTHPLTVAHDLDTALLLRDFLPRTWAVFQAGDASWARAQVVVKEAEGLAKTHWPAYDDAAARVVATSTRLRDTLRTTRERLQEDTAAARARTTHERRHVALELGNDGGAALIVNGTAPEWVGFDHALHRAAVAAHGVEGETRTLAQLRHAPRRTAVTPHSRRAGTGSVGPVRDLLVEGIKQRADEDWMGLQVPKRRGVDVQLILTVPALAWLGKTTEQAQLAGYGPIDLQTAKGLAGTATSFIRVLTDPLTGVRLTMDRTIYRPPVDLARWVKIRDGRSRFPGSNRPAHLADIDHAREWHHNGGTDEVNLVALDRASHNMKSNDLFHQELLPDGNADWEDPWGHHFLDPPPDPLDPAPTDLLPEPDPDPPCPF